MKFVYLAISFSLRIIYRFNAWGFKPWARGLYIRHLRSRGISYFLDDASTLYGTIVLNAVKVECRRLPDNELRRFAASHSPPQS